MLDDQQPFEFTQVTDTEGSANRHWKLNLSWKDYLQQIMGIFHSKVAPSNKKEQKLNNELDPRSPTININRSPIGVENALDKPSITKVRDLTSDLTEILDNAQTPDRIIGEKLQSILDPRSPVSFARTPLILDESDASNVSLRGTSLEYEEISCEGELPYGDKSLSFKDCEYVPDMGTADPIEAGSLFSDTSLNTELKAEIDNIIQGLSDAGIDPRSPSIDIQRTPIVFEDEEDAPKDEQNEIQQSEDKQLSEISQLVQPHAEEGQRESKTNTTLTIIHLDENQLVVTPKREKFDLAVGQKVISGIVAPRTPLGCVTNVKTPGNNNNMRKTALFTHMKQNAVVVGNSAELISGKKLQPKSKIPTLRMK